MSILITLVCVAIIAFACAYFRARLWLFSGLAIAAILAAGFGVQAWLATSLTPTWVMLGIFVVLFALPLNLTPVRRALFSGPLLKVFKRVT